MADVLGYARVSTGDQDVAGQALRLREAGAIKVFTDIRSGRTMERPGLATLLDYAIAAARARGKHPGRQPLDPDRAEAALTLVAAGLSPTAAARQVGLGRSTVYRELRRSRADRLKLPI